MKSPLVVLAECGVPLLLVGGTAVQCYGFSRFTKDFDCIVAHEDEGRLSSALLAAGFEEFTRSAVVVRHRHSKQSIWIVDTLLCDVATFREMWEHRRPQRLGANTLSIASPQHLIGMKLHAMTQNPARLMFDMLDCLELIKHQRGTFTRDELVAICDRFATPELKAKLLAAYDQ